MIVSTLLTASIGFSGPVIAGAGKTYSSGGKEGQVVMQALEEVERGLQTSETFGLRNRILGVLRKGLAEKFGIKGWNGFKAKAVLQMSVEHAVRFVKEMPFDLKDPTVRVIPTGCVCFSWRADRGRLCTVVFDTDGRYHCASVIGAAESAITTNSKEDVYAKAMEVFA